MGAPAAKFEALKSGSTGGAHARVAGQTPIPTTIADKTKLSRGLETCNRPGPSDAKGARVAGLTEPPARVAQNRPLRPARFCVSGAQALNFPVRCAVRSVTPTRT